MGPQQLLIIVFSIVPGVVPLKCFTEQHSHTGCLIDPDIPTDQCSMQCGRETHCMLKTGNSVTHGNFTIRGCALPGICSSDGCKYIVENGAPVQICCCKTNLCNKKSKFDSDKQMFESYVKAWKIGEQLRNQAKSTVSPSLANVECFTEQKYERGAMLMPGIPTNQLSMMCNNRFGYCMVKSGNSAVHGNYTIRGCAQYGTCGSEGCRTIIENGSSVDLCCCNGNFCNTRSIWTTYKAKQAFNAAYLESALANVPALRPTFKSNQPSKKANPFAKHSSRFEPESRRMGWNEGRKKASAPLVQTTSTIGPVEYLWPNQKYEIAYRQSLTTSTVAPAATTTIRVRQSLQCMTDQRTQSGGLIRSDLQPMCNRDDFCMRMSGTSSMHGNFTIRACTNPGQCTFVGCSDVYDRDFGSVNLCCCQGDFCNVKQPSSYPPYQPLYPYEIGRVNQAAGPMGLVEAPETTTIALPQALAGIKCFGQQRSQRGPLIHSEISRKWSTISCANVTHCMKAHAEDSSQFGRITLYGCAPKDYCSFEGCQWVNDKDIGKMYLCCCKGNYCNPASTLTVLLSIATVVAVFAINF